MTHLNVPSRASTPPPPPPAWLRARVRYHCDLIELCVLELEARGLLGSDIPTLAAEALRRWADGSTAGHDRACWATRGALDGFRKGRRALNEASVRLIELTRVAVRVRAAGEVAETRRLWAEARLKQKAFRSEEAWRKLAGLTCDHTRIGKKGRSSDRLAHDLLVSVGVETERATRLVRPSATVLRLDQDLARALKRRREKARARRRAARD